MQFESAINRPSENTLFPIDTGTLMQSYRSKVNDSFRNNDILDPFHIAHHLPNGINFAHNRALTRVDIDAYILLN